MKLFNLRNSLKINELLEKPGLLESHLLKFDDFIIRNDSFRHPALASSPSEFHVQACFGLDSASTDSGWRAPLASVSGLGRLCFRAPAERFVCETHERRQGFPFRLDRTRPMPKTRADCSLCLCALQSVQREVEPAACLQSCVPISSSAKLLARWQPWAKTFDSRQPCRLNRIRNLAWRE